jgi:hypothetical protein
MHIMHEAVPLEPVGRPAAPAGRGAFARNADFDWDEFSSSDYCAHNYITLREDDAEILDLVVRWFARTAGSHRLAGLDVGAGPNLYPALSMLPYCDSLTLSEFSATNVAWLREATAALPEQWLPFWRVISPDGSLGDFAEAAAALADRAVVEQGSVFDLPTAAWDLGTMFFVAESISQDPAEFSAAVASFVRAVRPGGPFAAAFMERSEGYQVADQWYPATAVGRREIRRCLEQVGEELAVHRVEMRPAPLRPGYTGMIIATGLAR